MSFLPVFCSEVHHDRAREKFAYPLVLRTSTTLNVGVRNPSVLVQTVLLETGNLKNNWAFNVFNQPHFQLCKLFLT